MSVTGGQHFTPVAGGIECILCQPLGRGLLEASVWFLPDVTPCALSFADSALYPFALKKLQPRV